MHLFQLVSFAQLLYIFDIVGQGIGGIPETLAMIPQVGEYLGKVGFDVGCPQHLHVSMVAQ